MTLHPSPSDYSLAAVEAALRARGLAHPLHWQPQVASTQEWAREAAAGAPDGAVFLTDHQTAGRGRRGRRWDDGAAGALLLTVLARPDVEAYPRLFMVAALSVALAVEQTTGLPCPLKWPNDVLLGGAKVAGVLVEGEFSGEAPDFALVGLGVNANNDPSGLAGLRYPATSLARALGHPVDRGALLQALLVWFSRLRREDGAAVERLWRARLATLGQRARVETPQGVVEGTAEAVEPGGALVLRLDDGSTRSVVAGDITSRG